MKIDPKTNLPQARRRASSLPKVLRQCEDVKVLVVESARDLSALNADLEAGATPPASASAAIQVNMQKVSEKMSVVVSALESELRERDMLDHQFAAAVEQEEGARHASLHDALTGMPNRALFHDRLEHGIAQAKRHGWTWR